MKGEELEGLLVLQNEGEGLAKTVTPGAHPGPGKRTESPTEPRTSRQKQGQEILP